MPVARRRREVERIFDFYIGAEAILREEERRWYGFEIAEVIEHGESLLELMPDPPPLSYYALGALYQRLGNHEAAVEYLSRLNEDELCDETHRSYAVTTTASLCFYPAKDRISAVNRTTDARCNQESGTRTTTQCGKDC